MQHGSRHRYGAACALHRTQQHARSSMEAGLRRVADARRASCCCCHGARSGPVRCAAAAWHLLTLAFAEHPLRTHREWHGAVLPRRAPPLPGLASADLARQGLSQIDAKSGSCQPSMLRMPTPMVGHQQKWDRVKQSLVCSPAGRRARPPLAAAAAWAKRAALSAAPGAQTAAAPSGGCPSPASAPGRPTPASSARWPACMPVCLLLNDLFN